MQAVSKSYSPYTDERFVGIDITFRLVDLGAAGQATPGSSGVEGFSVLEQPAAEQVKMVQYGLSC